MAANECGNTAPVVRLAGPEDVPTVLALIRELADYEQALTEVQATEQALSAALFGDRPAAYCHVVEHGGQVGGFALWFLNFSTWLGLHGIYLEDLYVRPAMRGLGLGKALLRTLADLCVQRGYGRLEWWVLDWNEPARGFYRSIGAEAMEEWTVHRVSGDALRHLAGPAPEPWAADGGTGSGDATEM
jgi:GNAT superfamily N-acetyltransferase